MVQVKEAGESECCIVMMQIQTTVWHESEPTSSWSPVARGSEELYLGRNANDDFNSEVSASSTASNNCPFWMAAGLHVLELQVCIAKATNLVAG